MVNTNSHQEDGKSQNIPFRVLKVDRPQTNADRIRAMTDEELAHELALVAGWDRKQYEKAKSVGIEMVMLTWLQQPPKGDG